MKLLSHLSRITSGGNFLPQIDGLRFIAIVWVIAYHVWQIGSYHFSSSLNNGNGSEGTRVINTLFSAGRWGVQLFFAISGFILGLPFAKQYLCNGPPVNIKKYFVRRITRLEPPYIIHLGFLFLFCCLVLRHFPTHPALYYTNEWAVYAWAHIFPSLIYSNGFLFQTHPYPNVVLWSLEVEIQFYILAPWMASIFIIARKEFRRSLIVSAILMATLIGIIVPPSYIYVFSLAGNIQYFLVGFLFCDIYLTSTSATLSQRKIWDFLFLLAFSLIIMLQSYRIIELMLPWLIFTVLASAFKGDFCVRFLRNPWIVTIGGMCYTIYMYHWIMISVLLRLTEKLQTHVFWLDIIIQFAVLSVMIIIICAFLFSIFERPFMKKDWHIKLLKAMRGIKT